MGSNLTRFYFDVDDEVRTGFLNSLAFEDVETLEADAYEEDLQSKDIVYLRIDL